MQRRGLAMILPLLLALAAARAIADGSKERKDSPTTVLALGDDYAQAVEAGYLSLPALTAPDVLTVAVSLPPGARLTVEDALRAPVGRAVTVEPSIALPAAAVFAGRDGALDAWSLALGPAAEASTFLLAIRIPPTAGAG